MLQKIDVGNEKVVAFKWEGEFDKAAFEHAMTQFLPELKIREKMNIYLELEELGKVEAEAVWRDLKFGAENFKELKDKIDRVALVTELSWVKNLAEMAYSFVSDIKIKTYGFAEKDKAIHWINEQSHVL